MNNNNIWDGLFQYCEYCEYDGHGFVIVDSNKTAGNPEFYASLRSVLGLTADENADDFLSQYNLDGDYWNFGDECSACSNCNGRIITQASSGLPEPYWVNEGEILCKKCIRKNMADYIAWVVQCNDFWELDEEDLLTYDFVFVADRLEIGLHRGQNDNRFALLQWVRKHGLEGAVRITDWNIFTTTFALYVRHVASEEDGERAPLLGEELQGIREALLQNPENPEWANLLNEFRIWPNPATVIETQLRGLHA